MAQITYADKSTMNENASIPATNKVRAVDMNEIKNVVNSNYTELTQKDILTAYVTSDVSKSATSDYIVRNLTAQSQIGNNLTINNGTIVIGSGISKILVSASCMLVCSSTGSVRNLSIRKNNTNVKTASDGVGNSTNWLSLSLTDCLMDVQQGDAIGMQMYTLINDTVKGGSSYTYITVQVVEYSS